MSIFPKGACDTHMHFYDECYPTARGAILTPPDATPDDYRTVQTTLGIERVVAVQPTTYGLDNSCQIDATTELGSDHRLVVVVDSTTPRSTLERLHTLGARGARFHMLPGGAVGWEQLRPTAERIAELGWHIQLQMDGNHLADRLDLLADLPTELVIDHVGRFMPPPAPTSTEFSTLLQLLEAGRTWVKLSAPYESTPAELEPHGTPIFPSVTALVRVLVERTPERLLWATNWPHPGQADPLTVDQIASLMLDWLPTDALRQQVLVTNPEQLYDFEPSTSGGSS
jgi:D-galactarolactone isomerase